MTTTDARKRHEENARLHHQEQVEWANALEACGSTPEVARVIEGILADHAAGSLEEHHVAAVVEALTNPFAFAKTKARERGRWNGDRDARQHMARQLALGDLAEEDFRG